MTRRLCWRPRLTPLRRCSPQRMSRSGGGIGRPYGRSTGTIHPSPCLRLRWMRPLAGLSPRCARGRSERIATPPCLSRGPQQKWRSASPRWRTGDASQGRSRCDQPPGLVPGFDLADPGRRGPWAGEVSGSDKLFDFFVCRRKSAGTHPGPHPGGQCDGASWGFLGRFSPPPPGCALPSQPGDRLRRPASGPWPWGITNSLRGTAHSSPVRYHGGGLSASATSGQSRRPRSHVQRRRWGGFVATNADDLTRLLLPPQLDVRSSVVEEDDLGSPERLTPSQRFDEAQLPIPRPVGARLLSFAREWNRLTTDQFVRSVVRKGYRIELDSSPNLSPVPIPMQLSRDSEKAQSLRQEIISLQERRRLASGVRLEVPQPICPQREIQDDYSQSSDQRVASRGLGGECRPQRRLLPHPHTQEVPTPTSVCCRNGRRAPGFPIQGPTVRTDFSAKGIYESNTTSRTSGAHARGLSSTVSRRLDTTKYRQVITGSANKLVAQCHAPSRSGTKCAQVTLGTHSATDTHRCRISSRRRSDVPADGKSSKDRKQSISASIGSSRDSLFLALPAWTYELGNGCNPIRETAPQTSAVLPASPLGACIKECGSSYPSETQSAQSSSPMVVGQGVHTGRDVVRHSRGSGAAIHRCVRVGLGSPYGHTSGKRSMVCEGGHAPHQPTGDDRSTECIASLSDTVSRTNDSIDVRQCHRRVISDETGRYSLTAYVPISEGSTAPSTRHTYLPSGQTHAEGEECISGPAPQERSADPATQPSETSVTPSCAPTSVYSRIWKLPVIFSPQMPMYVRCVAMRGALQCAARTSLIGTTLAELSKQLRNITYRQLFKINTPYCHACL